MNITEFLEARIAEDEALAQAADSSRWLPEDKGVTFEWYADDFHDGEAQARLTADTKANMRHVARHDPSRVLAECAAKRAIIKQHEEWPVLVEREPQQVGMDANDLQSMTYRMSREIAWLTEREYVKRFGVEPPTTPMIRALAAIYSEHPDYQPEWKL